MNRNTYTRPHVLAPWHTQTHDPQTTRSTQNASTLDLFFFFQGEQERSEGKNNEPLRIPWLMNTLNLEERTKSTHHHKSIVTAKQKNKKEKKRKVNIKDSQTTTKRERNVSKSTNWMGNNLRPDRAHLSSGNTSLALSFYPATSVPSQVMFQATQWQTCSDVAKTIRKSVCQGKKGCVNLIVRIAPSTARYSILHSWQNLKAPFFTHRQTNTPKI